MGHVFTRQHMTEAQAETYRKHAEEACRKATETSNAEFRRQWIEIAKHYEMLADFAKKTKPMA